MRNFGLALSLASLVVLFAADQAFAADDTYISVAGADAGDCAIAAPCASLHYALRRTTPGGTITILTSGQYGPVDITQAVHIVAAGVTAVVSGVRTCANSSSTPAYVAAICIDAASNDVVTLNGLTVQVPLPYKPQSSGIMFNTGAALQVENCVIGPFSTYGITFYPRSSAHLSVFKSTINIGAEGIDMMSLGGSSHALFDGVEVREAEQGIVIEGGGSGSVQATIRNSSITDQEDAGINLEAGPVQIAIMLDRSVIANARSGVSIAGSNAVMRIGDTTITPNPFEGGPIASYGNNRFFDGAYSVPAPTTIPLK